MNLKKLFNDEAGVSPIVATLVLVVVAIAGAAAVGTIMGSFSSDVSDSANSEDAANGASTEIIVAGSTTVQPVSELIAKAYMEENKGVKITVQAGGSDAGIASAGMGIIDVGSASKFTPDAAKTKYPDLEEHVIGGSAVVVITNTATPGVASTTTPLTAAQLLTIYDSNNANADAAFVSGVVAVQRTEGSGTEETFAKFVTSKASSNVDDAVDEGTAVVQANAIGNQGVLDKVATTSSAVGFVDYGFAKDDSRVTIIGVDPAVTGYTAIASVTGDDVEAGVKARLSDISTTETSATYYPVELCRPLVYLTNGEPSSIVNNYIQFAMSPASLDSFHEVGYYGITEL